MDLVESSHILAITSIDVGTTIEEVAYSTKIMVLHSCDGRSHTGSSKLSKAARGAKSKEAAHRNLFYYYNVTRTNNLSLVETVTTTGIRLGTRISTMSPITICKTHHLNTKIYRVRVRPRVSQKMLSRRGNSP